MSQNLRPTSPQPPAVPGKIVVNPYELQEVLRVAGLAGVGVYSRILSCAQFRQPCTISVLVEMFGDPLAEVSVAVEALLDAGLLTWVEEPENGGAA